MTAVTISLRVDKELHSQMKLHDEINWSAVLRRSAAEELDRLERIDKTRARAAAKRMDTLRNAGAFSRGPPSGQVIRQWRDKRR